VCECLGGLDLRQSGRGGRSCLVEREALCKEPLGGALGTNLNGRSTSSSASGKRLCPRRPALSKPKGDDVNGREAPRAEGRPLSHGRRLVAPPRGRFTRPIIGRPRPSRRPQVRRIRLRVTTPAGGEATSGGAPRDVGSYSRQPMDRRIGLRNAGLLPKPGGCRRSTFCGCQHVARRRRSWTVVKGISWMVDSPSSFTRIRCWSAVTS
jgi:hypothetical protein